MVLVAVTPTVVTTFCVLRDWLSQAAIRGSCGGAVVERIGMNNSGNAIDCELSMGRIQWSRVQQPPRLDSTSVMPEAWRMRAFSNASRRSSAPMVIVSETIFCLKTLKR